LGLTVLGFLPLASEGRARQRKAKVK
jgi:hypothetical protein